MRDFIILFVHVIVTLARLAKPGGIRAVVAESALLRHQLRVLNRCRKRAPNLCAADRIIAGLCTKYAAGHGSMLEQLCHAALKRDPADPSAFLDTACDGDVELRQEVQSPAGGRGRSMLTD